jgi:hypothetical protein
MIVAVKLVEQTAYDRKLAGWNPAAVESNRKKFKNSSAVREDAAVPFHFLSVEKNRKGSSPPNITPFVLLSML